MEDPLKLRHIPKWYIHLFTAKHLFKTFLGKFIKVVAKSFIHDVTLPYQVFFTSVPKQKPSDIDEYVSI